MATENSSSNTMVGVVVSFTLSIEQASAKKYKPKYKKIAKLYADFYPQLLLLDGSKNLLLYIIDTHNVFFLATCQIFFKIVTPTNEKEIYR